MAKNTDVRGRRSSKAGREVSVSVASRHKERARPQQRPGRTVAVRIQPGVARGT